MRQQAANMVEAQEAQAQFFELLARVEAGEEIIFTRNGVAFGKMLPALAKPTPNASRASSTEDAAARITDADRV
jgi:prevent-host-death family protein